MQAIRIGLTIFIIILLTIPLVLVQLFAKTFLDSFSQKIPYLYHSFILKMIGIKVNISGNIIYNKPVIIVANHWSWVDILVLGSTLPCYFVAKSEISGWPIFGFMAKLQNTIFVNRSARGRGGTSQVNEISERLQQNKTVVLFAEGTSNDGNRVLNFKSSLLAVAKPSEECNPLVQPVTIVYNKMSGMPLNRTQRPNIAWYGDMDLIPHLKNLLLVAPIEVSVIFGDAVRYDDFPSRKEITQHLENSIRIAYTDHANGLR